MDGTEPNEESVKPREFQLPDDSKTFDRENPNMDAFISEIFYYEHPGRCEVEGCDVEGPPAAIRVVVTAGASLKLMVFCKGCMIADARHASKNGMGVSDKDSKRLVSNLLHPNT